MSHSIFVLPGVSRPTTEHPVRRRVEPPTPVHLALTLVSGIIIGVLLTSSMGGTDEWMKGIGVGVPTGILVGVLAGVVAYAVEAAWYALRYERAMHVTGWAAYEASTPNNH